MSKHTWTLVSTTLSHYMQEAVGFLDQQYPDLPYKIAEEKGLYEIHVEEDESEKNLQALALIQIKSELHILWLGYMAGWRYGMGE